jgi:outer membrane immunogenic protein
VRAPAPAPAPIYMAPIFTWSGFYVGANIGATWGSDRDRHHGLTAYALNPNYNYAANYLNAVLPLGWGHGRDGSRTGLTGGVQAGFNWQFGAMVFGIEADINARGRGGRDRGAGVAVLQQNAFDNEDLVLAHSSRGSGGSNWFGTIRPRLGVAMDRTLLYVTGGLAYGGNRRGGDSFTLFLDQPPKNQLLEGDEIYATYARTGRRSSNWGWTLGAGVEHAFTNNWTMKLEYLYVDLDRGRRNAEYTLVDSGNLGGIQGGAAIAQNLAFRGGSSRSADKFHVVRVGFNWKFGGPAAPVMGGGPVVAAY